MGSLVGLKLVGDGNLELPRRLIFGHGDVKNILRDGAVEPRADAAVNLLPSRISAARGDRSVDVVKEPELAAHRLEEGRPLAVVGVVQFQFDGNVCLDVDRSVGVEEDGACRCIRSGGHGGGARGGRRRR